MNLGTKEKYSSHDYIRTYISENITCFLQQWNMCLYQPFRTMQGWEIYLMDTINFVKFS